MNQLEIANRNIQLYIFVKIFAKRVFIPLSAIYFIDHAGFSIREIGMLAAFYSIVQLLAEVPTGYFADKIGRITSIRIGALLAMFGTLSYVIFQNKIGIFSGSALEALGYSFMAGAGEALIHDSLLVKKQEHEYTKVLSRAQSASLIINAILITLVPMTYVIDPRYPFFLGAVAYFSLFAFSLFMHDVTRITSVVQLKIPDFRKIVGKRHILMFAMSFGIIGALYTTPVDMLNVALKEYGIRADHLGWVYGLASVVGAIMGSFIHHLQKMKLSQFLFVDLTVLISLYLAVLSQSYILLAFIMLISISFWRYRRIIYQSYLLTLYPTQYKATLISGMNNLEQLNMVWLPIALTFAISHTSTPVGFGIGAIFIFFTAPLFYSSTLRFFRSNPVPTDLPAPTAKS